MKRQRQNKKLVIGLTGGIASGKTTVASMFKSLGASVINADAVAHKLMRPGKPVYRRVVRAFGNSIVRRDRTIDRAALGAIVFANRSHVKRINRIMHPPIIAEINRLIAAQRTGLIVVDAPLLLEAGCRGMVDKVVVVAVDRATQIKRLQTMSRLSRAQILARIRSQMSLGKKIRHADFIIDNSANKQKTKKQVAQIRRQLWRN